MLIGECNTHISYWFLRVEKAQERFHTIFCGISKTFGPTAPQAGQSRGVQDAGRQVATDEPRGKNSL